MEVTREWLEEQIQHHQLQESQYLANANASLGVVQAMQAVLARLEAPPEPAKPEPQSEKSTH